MKPFEKTKEKMETEPMHKWIENDAVKFDLDSDQIIHQLCIDNHAYEQRIQSLESAMREFVGYRKKIDESDDPTGLVINFYFEMESKCIELLTKR